MITNPINYPQTEVLIADALELIGRLHQQISLEAEALLSSAIPETLADIAAAKQQLVKQLEQNNQQLNRALSMQNLPSTDEGIQNYFKLAEKSGFEIEKASSLWKQIKTLSTECRKLNEQNGMSINLLMLHNQRALQILKGQPLSASTYGRDGTSHGNTIMRSLLSA